MWIKRSLVSTVLLFGMAASASAADSVYTDLNLEEDCTFYRADEHGASGYCQGYRGYPVLFDEGDLRQMVRFGHVAKVSGQWESFGQFNHVNNKIEWRVKDKVPYAAILRRFVENSNDDGEHTEAVRGQVLVVSTVADHENPTSCVIGYVDARANANANELARALADETAKSFVCGKDKPGFKGAKGPHAGDPTSYFE